MSTEDFIPPHEPSGQVSVLPLIETEDDYLPYIHATINDVEGLFLIDTGYYLTMISEEFLKKTGARRRSLDRCGFYSATSTNDTGYAIVKRISIGHEKFGPCPVMVADLSRENGTRKQKYDGVIGMPTLKQLVFSIDSKNKEVVLNPAACEGVAVPIRDDNNNGHLIFDAVIAGYPLELVADTGCYGGITVGNEQLLEQIKLSGGDEVEEVTKTIEMATFNGASRYEFKTLVCELVDLGGLTLEGVEVIHYDSPVNVFGMATLFDYCKITFDAPGQTLYFQAYP